MFKRCLSIKGKSQTDSALDFTSVSQQNSFPTKTKQTITKLYKTQKLSTSSPSSHWNIFYIFYFQHHNKSSNPFHTNFIINFPNY